MSKKCLGKMNCGSCQNCGGRIRSVADDQRHITELEAKLAEVKKWIEALRSPSDDEICLVPSLKNLRDLAKLMGVS